MKRIHLHLPVVFTILFLLSSSSLLAQTTLPGDHKVDGDFEVEHSELKIGKDPDNLAGGSPSGNPGARFYYNEDSSQAAPTLFNQLYRYDSAFSWGATEDDGLGADIYKELMYLDSDGELELFGNQIRFGLNNANTGRWVQTYKVIDGGQGNAENYLSHWGGNYTWTKGAPDGDKVLMEVRGNTSFTDVRIFSTYTASTSPDVLVLGNFDSTFGIHLPANSELRLDAGSSITIDGNNVLTEAGAGTTYVAPTGTTKLSLGTGGNTHPVNSFAFGSAAVSHASDSLAVGTAIVQASANDSFAFAGGVIASSSIRGFAGAAAYVTGERGFGFGPGAQVTSEEGFAFGEGAKALNFETNIALGKYAEASSTTGACVAIGNVAKATGFGSMALGYYSTASGEQTSAMGFYANASGPDAVAIGRAANASGRDSLALSRNCTASNQHAVAIGNVAVASAYRSFAIGSGVVADGWTQTALGQFNVAEGDNFSNGQNDILLIVGNGADDTNRSNAMKMQRDGDLRVSGDIEAKGVIRVAPGGDLSMGAFTSSAAGNPADLDNALDYPAP